jgi:predicted RNA-binding Zn-ribbon protein involved in translation (DUF1610 family)
MKRERSNKKMAPSRERYEKQNPTVSARMPIDKRNRLMVVLERLGLTLTQLLIKFADEQEITTRPLAEARKQGFLEAKEMFAVYYPCPKCGKQIPINGVEAKAAAAQYMAEHGWAHRQCPDDR